MTLSWRELRAAAGVATLVLMGGCSTSPPGAGFTGGDKPTFSADEKPAVRDDLPLPANPDRGDAPLASGAAVPDDSAAALPPNEAGGGAGNPPARGAAKDQTKPASSGTTTESMRPAAGVK